MSCVTGCRRQLQRSHSAAGGNGKHRAAHGCGLRAADFCLSAARAGTGGRCRRCLMRASSPTKPGRQRCPISRAPSSASAARTAPERAGRPISTTSNTRGDYQPRLVFSVTGRLTTTRHSPRSRSPLPPHRLAAKVVRPLMCFQQADDSGPRSDHDLGNGTAALLSRVYDSNRSMKEKRRLQSKVSIVTAIKIGAV